MNQLKIHEVEDAIVEHLKASFPGMAKQIASLTDSDVDGDAEMIVTDMPAIRVLYRTGKLDRLTDQTALTYEAALQFVVLCGAKDLGTAANERQAALKLVSDVLDKLAGKRLEALASYQAGSRPQIVLQGAELFQAPGQSGTWYAVPISVEGVTQYDENEASA